MQVKNIKVIFGLKLATLRKDKGLSQKDLAEKCGLSLSYYNEIEKGKKYPKHDKILMISNALAVDYDKLVSLSTSPFLSPLTQILNSELFNELPFESFGIEREALFQLLAQAPAKVMAFINLFLEMADQFQFKNDDMYFSVLKAYQEIHHNFFEQIEIEANTFRGKELDVSSQKFILNLENILNNKYNYHLNSTDFEDFIPLQNFRSITIKTKKQFKLFINKKINQQQRAFIIARELGFNVMNYTERPWTSSWLNPTSLTSVFNNFYASYFAGALLIPYKSVLNDIHLIFSQKTWNNDFFNQIIRSYYISTETYFQRLSNILMQIPGVESLFFIRFDHQDASEYKITKELQLTESNLSFNDRMQDIYFKRWVAHKNLMYYLSIETTDSDWINMTKSIQPNSVYYSISFHRSKVLLEGGEFLSLGFEISNEFEKTVSFYKDASIYINSQKQDYERELMKNEDKQRIKKQELIENELNKFVIKHKI